MKAHLQAGRSSVLFATLALLLAFTVSFGQDNQPFSINTSPLPPPTGYVNDLAGVIDQQTKARLEARLKQFKESTNPSVEIAVAVVRTTGGRELQEYSLAVARGWGIGSKEDDNPSALLMVAIDDRKYFTQVSKDLEDELPDGLVGSLQRQYLVPEFRKGNYSKGISDTVEAYIATIEGRASGGGTRPAGETSAEDEGSVLGTLCCLAIIVIIILIILSSNRGGGGRNGRNDRWGGGGFGGGGGALPWIIGSIIANAGSSSGSSSSGWGGGSSGGGFGGFGGGGDFGGGGAGGSW